MKEIVNNQEVVSGYIGLEYVDCDAFQHYQASVNAQTNTSLIDIQVMNGTKEINAIKTIVDVDQNKVTYQLYYRDYKPPVCSAHGCVF